jgi:hypothetical protein
MSAPEKSALRILIAGDWQADIHEPAWALGLRALGHQVSAFSWHERFAGLLGRIQNKVLFGPAIWRLNLDLVAAARRERPDVVLLYRATHVLPWALEQLRALPGVTVASYNNDDPFSTRAAPLLWQHYLAGLPLSHVHMVYRHKNVDDLERRGITAVHLVRSAYLPAVDRPVTLTEEERGRLGSDVLFAGHYEADHRIASLEALAAEPTALRLVGPDWDRAPPWPWLRRFQPIRAPRGEEYVRTIAAAKIALVFLSTLNNDTYTRRCFEIPAIGTFMLCQRTADMEDMFRPGVEAEYFSSPAELVDKVRHYLAHPEQRARVAAAGRRRVEESGHDIFSRMREVDAILRGARAP